MKKIICLSFLIILCLTACKEKEPDQDNQVVGDNDKIDSGDEQDNSGDEQDKSDGEQDETENENSGIVVEDNIQNNQDDTEEIVELTPVFNPENWNAPHYVESGELKEAEYQFLTAVCSVNGVNFPINIKWYRYYGEFATARVYTEQENQDVEYDYFVEPLGESCKGILTLTLEERRHHYYWIIDLYTGELDAVGDISFGEDITIRDVCWTEDGKNALVVTSDGIYHYDGFSLRDVTEKICSAGLDTEKMYILEGNLVGDKFIIQASGTNENDEHSISYYVYDITMEEAICTVNGLVNGSLDSFSILDDLFLTYCKDGCFTILNVITGQERVTESMVGGESFLYMDKYIVLRGDDGMVKVFDAYNGRLLGQAKRPSIAGGDNQVKMVPADDGIYFQVYNWAACYIYRLELE